MSVYLVDPTNGVEVVLPKLASITTTGGRVLKKDAYLSTNKPLVATDNPLPHEWLLENKVLSDIEDTERKISYMLMCGQDLVCVAPEKERALYGYLESANLPDDARKATILSTSLRFIGKGIVIGHAKEAEDATLGAGAATAADADASGGSCVQLNAQNEDVYFSITQSVWKLPLGDYELYVRAKDSAQVATDCTLEVYNTTDSATVATANKTLTASYAWYGLDFTLDSADSGNAIRFRAKKNTATANTISADLFAVVMV